VEAYAKAQGLWHDQSSPEPVFTDTLELDLATVEPSLAGPRRPQDRIALGDTGTSFDTELPRLAPGVTAVRSQKVEGADYQLHDGDVVIAAITSCTNTSNPSVMLAAGLLAKKAAEKGLKAKPWVKTSLAPGSQVVSDYYAAAGLQEYLDKIGFNLVGYGCTTCIGNSGPLPEPVAEAIEEGDLAVAAVLSGNRNFEGRIHALVRANYLASPPLVVAYALAGTVRINLTTDPLGEGSDGKPVYLRDIWPTNQEVADTVRSAVKRDSFKSRYGNVFEGPPQWRAVTVPGGMTYDFQDRSTYLARAPYFDNMPKEPGPLSDVTGARELAIFGDSITTDHISPAGSIKVESPAGEYLIGYQVRPTDFNTYGARRGNHNVMVRGTFANIRIKNEMVPGVEGGMTKLMPDGTVMPIYDAAVEYKKRGVPLVIFGGKEYGTGSSRDWAAKGTLLLGVKAVIVESFERIHRSNLVGMGVLPLMFKEGTSRQTLGLTGTETLDITGVKDGIKPRMDLTLTIHDPDGGTRSVPLVCRIDTLDEVEYFRHGGILQYVLRGLLKAA
jgi:aconitate hydratase